MTGSLESYAVTQGCDRVREASGAACVEKLCADQLSRPVYTRDAASVVSTGPYDSGDVSPVPVVIIRVSGFRYGIDSIHVINVAIPVIIDPVSSNFVRIRPHVSEQVGVVVVDSGVDNKDQRLVVGWAGGVVPC